MKLLIIGSQGMLGKMLTHVLADKNPVCFDIEEIDITDYEMSRKKIEELKPDVIVSAAAFTDVDGAEEKKEAAFLVNDNGVKNLALIAKELGAVLVHYSTDYVFGGEKEAGYKEDDKTGPAVNAYGESKLAGEDRLKEINPHFYLIRIAWLYGPFGKNFVDTMLQLAKTKDSLSVVNDQFGSPTFTKDVTLLTKDLLDKKSPYGIYHGVNSGITTWYDFAKKIFELSGKDIIVHPVSSDEFIRPAKRPTYSVLKDTKNLHMRSWEIALEDYLTNYYGR